MMRDSYEPNELRHITDLQHVRERPAMYFGDLDAPTIPNCLAREAFCLAIDQIVAHTCTRITVDFAADGSASVTHDGTPLGVENDSRFPGMSEMQAVAEIMGFCADHAASDYVHSNVCKNGMTALNALCERFELNNYRDGVHCLLVYNFGERESELQSIGPTVNRGVTVRLKPDGNMVRHTRFDAVQLQQWFTSIPIDTSGVEIKWNDLRDANAR
jgi:DNA gyrase subunit B